MHSTRASSAPPYTMGRRFPRWSGFWRMVGQTGRVPKPRTAPSTAVRRDDGDGHDGGQPRRGRGSVYATRSRGGRAHTEGHAARTEPAKQAGVLATAADPVGEAGVNIEGSAPERQPAEARSGCWSLMPLIWKAGRQAFFSGTRLCLVLRPPSPGAGARKRSPPRWRIGPGRWPRRRRSWRTPRSTSSAPTPRQAAQGRSRPWADKAGISLQGPWGGAVVEPPRQGHGSLTAQHERVTKLTGMDGLTLRVIHVQRATAASEPVAPGRSA